MALAQYKSLGLCQCSSRPSRQVAVSVRAMAGFGKSNKKVITGTENTGSYTVRTNKRRVDLAEELGKSKSNDKAVVSDNTPDMSRGNWFPLAKLSDFAGDKKRKLVELPGSKQFVLLHSYGGTIYAMNAYSTAYQYPLLDGKITDEKDGPAIETPLDGTQYDLKTGKVLKWCPKNTGNPIRSLLGTLKSSVDPVPLPVYPVVVKPDGEVFVRLS